jgi:hypothetical protein|tara:strand:- start:544 stop:732 length:189 start_codon:yes stop_codon:yes gene_type:complete
MKKTIGNFIVELSGESLMIKNLKGDLLKAESVKPFESDDKFKELCIGLEEKIADRKAKGLSV